MEFNYDRLCPSCGEMSLVESKGRTWECLNPKCKETFDEDFLDSRGEESYWSD